MPSRAEAIAPDGQGQLGSRALPLGEGGEATGQQPPAAVERVLARPAPAERLLLPAPVDVVDDSLAEPHDVEGVQHPHRVGRLVRTAVA